MDDKQANYKPATYKWTKNEPKRRPKRHFSFNFWKFDRSVRFNTVNRLDRLKHCLEVARVSTVSAVDR